jgi:hypothetical protein
MSLRHRLDRLEAQTAAPSTTTDPRIGAALAALSDEVIATLAAWADRGGGPSDDREHQAIAAYQAAYGTEA